MTGGRLPDFVIAGEMKTGTTSLAHYLDAHPDAFVSPTWPVRFFDERFDRGLDWYRDQFAGAPATTVAGDDTPSYLFDAAAVERMAGVLPDARLVVLVRDPVARAWSHYWHHDRTGFDRRGFDTAVRHELACGLGPHGTPEGSGYLARGRYVESLARVFERWPRQQVHVAFYESLRDDPATAFADVCGFLGIDDGFRPANLGTVYNVGWAPRRRRALAALLRIPLVDRLPERGRRWLSARTTSFVSDLVMEPELQAELTELYDDPNRALAALVGPLPWH